MIRVLVRDNHYKLETGLEFIAVYDDINIEEALMHKFKPLFIALISIVFTFVSMGLLPEVGHAEPTARIFTVAMDSSPVGMWKTLDDKTGEAKSFIKVWTDKGELFGRIEKLVRKPGENPNPLCDKCTGDNKDKPVIGMTVMWGLKEDGEEWNGGQILDPDDGKIYKCKVELVDGGKKLEVRGFIGFALIGRTQTWVRAE
jgi:uncharacterized protein (DUF2147 family)